MQAAGNNSGAAAASSRRRGKPKECAIAPSLPSGRNLSVPTVLLLLRKPTKPDGSTAAGRRNCCVPCRFHAMQSGLGGRRGAPDHDRRGMHPNAQTGMYHCFRTLATVSDVRVNGVVDTTNVCGGWRWFDQTGND